MNQSFLSERVARLLALVHIPVPPSDFWEIETEGTKDGDWYERHLTNLRPFFHHVWSKIRENPSSVKPRLLLWTHNPQLFTDCLHLALATSDNVPLCLLLLTAALERALGNVYLLRGHHVPRLLRSLLHSAELEEVLGPQLVGLLQVLLGSPQSLNLRNILWHGFVAPAELPSSLLVCVLVEIAAMVGKKLDGVEVPPQQPVCLDYAALWNLPEIKLELLRELAHNSNLVSTAMLLHWNKAMEQMENKCYGECLVLILPQLENCLRQLYVRLHNCPSRLLLAEATVLYTTFDEMLDRVGDNRLLEQLGDGPTLLLLDILTCPEGPRLRDRLSHGEADLSRVPRQAAVQVLGVCGYILATSLPKQPEDPGLRELVLGVRHYKPSFHPVTHLKDKMVQLWKQLPPPLGEADRERWNRLTTRIADNWPPLLTQSREAKEAVTLMRQAANNACAVSDYLQEFAGLRSAQASKFLLTSRMRRNYASFQQMVSSIRSGLVRVLHQLLEMLAGPEKHSGRSKLLLQYTENLLSEVQRHRWQQCLQLGDKFHIEST